MKSISRGRLSTTTWTRFPRLLARLWLRAGGEYPVEQSSAPQDRALPLPIGSAGTELLLRRMQVLNDREADRIREVPKRRETVDWFESLRDKGK